MSLSGFVGFAAVISLHERDTYAQPSSRSRQLDALRRLQTAWRAQPDEESRDLEISASLNQVTVTCPGERLSTLVLYLHRRRAAFDDLPGPVLWSAGVSFGQIRPVDTAGGLRVPAGAAVSQAAVLSERAASGAVLAALSFLDVVNDYDAEGVGLGPTLKVRGSSPGEAFAAVELTFSPNDDDRGLRPDARPRSARGVVQRWNRDREHGFLVDSSDRYFYFDKRHLVSGMPPTVGQPVWFIPHPPMKRDSNPVAAALVGEGDLVDGTIAGRMTRGGRFIRVNDQAGFFQDLHMHGNAVRQDLDDGVEVRARVIVEPRGPMLGDVESAWGRAGEAASLPPRGESVSDEFVGAAVALLQKHGVYGVAGEVIRSTADRLPTKDHKASRVNRALVLVDHALHVWTRRALRLGGAESALLDLDDLGPINGVRDAALAAEALETYISEWQAPLSDWAHDLRPGLIFVEEALRHAGRLNPFLEGLGPHDHSGACARAAGSALAQFHLDGVVVSMAAEASALARRLNER